jgi:hypothetical protein
MAAFVVVGLAAGSASAASPSPATSTVVRPEAAAALQSAASVVRVDALRRQGDLTVKLFGTAGGDLAMNGLYTYLAFFASPDEGWRVFRLGDFLDYRLLSETTGRVTLEVRESVMNERTGDIGARTRRLLVSWRAKGDELPVAVGVASVR